MDKISEILSQDSSRKTEFFEILSYSLREIFRNVFEHSEAGELYFCAQYWNKSHKVELAIADSGIGIMQSLGVNPNFRFDNHKEALEFCLMPGVSGKTHLERRSDTWFNSGYGLYMVSRLARNGGNFVISSGDTAVGLSRKTKFNFRCNYAGTIIRVNLDIDKIGSIQKRLGEFREDGAKIAASIKGSAARPPSAMSLMLRRDFS